MLQRFAGGPPSSLPIEDFGLGRWCWDIHGQTLDWSPEQKAIYGVPDRDPTVNAQMFLQMVHPDDRDRIMAEASNLMSSGGAGYSQSFRIIRPDGVIRTVLRMARFQYNPSGEAYRLHGLDLDVTDVDDQAKAGWSSASQMKDIVFQRSTRGGGVVGGSSGAIGRAEAADRSAMLRRALNSGRMAAWQLDPSRQAIRVDDNSSRILGVPDLPNEIPISFFDALIEPEDLVGVVAARKAALRGESMAIEFRIRLANGTRRWLRCIGEAQSDRDEAAGLIVGVLYDITPRKSAESRLRESEANFRTVIEAMPQMVWSALPNGYRNFFNQQWSEFVGTSPNVSSDEGWRQFFHPDDHPEIDRHWSHSIATGEIYEVESRLQHHTGAYRWVLGRAVPVYDEDGEVVRWLGTCTDIHDMKIAHERQQLLLDEMDHRVKNILSLVQAVARQTFGMVPDAEEAQAAFDGRIQALAGAYSHLNHESWSQASFRHIILTSMHGCGAQPDAMTLDGPEVLLQPKTAVTFSMAVHELCTNAVKYGALSVPEGQVHVQWALQEDRLNFVWQESGGPKVLPPSRRGFGTRMIEHALATEAEGAIRLELGSDGVRCEMDACI